MFFIVEDEVKKDYSHTHKLQKSHSAKVRLDEKEKISGQRQSFQIPSQKKEHVLNSESDIGEDKEVLVGHVNSG